MENKYRHEYKYLITDGITVNRRVDGTDWPLLRYTQIQLMWAEALVGSDDVEGARTLLEAGCAQVVCAVLCRTPRHEH